MVQMLTKVLVSSPHNARVRNRRLDVEGLRVDRLHARCVFRGRAPLRRRRDGRGVDDGVVSTDDKLTARGEASEYMRYKKNVPEFQGHRLPTSTCPWLDRRGHRVTGKSDGAH